MKDLLDTILQGQKTLVCTCLIYRSAHSRSIEVLWWVTYTMAIICTYVIWKCHSRQKVDHSKTFPKRSKISFIPIYILRWLDRVQDSTGEESRGKVKVDTVHLWIFVQLQDFLNDLQTQRHSEPIYKLDSIRDNSVKVNQFDKLLDLHVTAH